jgi:hypothetical protein
VVLTVTNVLIFPTGTQNGLVNSMDQISPCESHSRTVTQETASHSCNMKMYYLVGSELLTAVVMKSPILWHTTPCIPLKVNQRFGKTCRLHLQALLATYFTLVSCLTYSSTVKMGTICSSETSVDFQRTTRRYILEDRTLVYYFDQMSSPLNSTQRIPSNPRSGAIFLNMSLFYRKLTIANLFSLSRTIQRGLRYEVQEIKSFNFAWDMVVCP